MIAIQVNFVKKNVTTEILIPQRLQTKSYKKTPLTTIKL